MNHPPTAGRDTAAPGREMVDPLPTARRLRALAAIGWPSAELARRIGVHPDDVPRLAAGKRRRVGQDIAEAVEVVYERLRDTPGPSTHARRRAERAGYLPPAAWADGAMGGDLHPTERPTAATSADAAYAALMRELLVEQLAPPPSHPLAQPIGPAEAERNRADLARACGFIDDYQPPRLLAVAS